MGVQWLVALGLIGAVARANSGGPITSLPGWPSDEKFPSMSSGFITVDEAHERNIFYWLIEADTAPADAPLVVWYQGGPGCSGMNGLFLENGPFEPTSTGLKSRPEYSWTKFANVLWVEAPAGVGFSYSDVQSDYNTNDNKTADDNYAFLENFIVEYPQYKGRDLYITGESYGGMYVPTLTYRVLTGPNTDLRDALKGIAVGNGIFNCDTEEKIGAAIQMNLFYYHALVSYDIYALWLSGDCNTNPNSATCQTLFTEAEKQVGEIFQQLTVQNEPNLDPDCLYQDFCIGNGTLFPSTDNPGWATGECNPSGSSMAKYLNRADVQKAIHADAQTGKTVDWSVCSDIINYTPDVGSLIPYYQDFFNLNSNLKILIYNGDVDIATVPFANNQACLHELAATRGQKKTVWQPWYVNGATAGYYEVYDRYSFATLRGAGHEVPTYQPANSFALISRFLAGQNFGAEDRPRPNQFPHLDGEGRRLRQFRTDNRIYGRP